MGAKRVEVSAVVVGAGNYIKTLEAAPVQATN